MAIGLAVHRGNFVYVYDERNLQLCAIGAGGDSQLVGYTGTTVSIKRGNFIYTYNERGMQLSARGV